LGYFKNANQKKSKQKKHPTFFTSSPSFKHKKGLKGGKYEIDILEEYFPQARRGP
jgi:hypothetical protein